MRLLHTSDWHLGRTFHGQDLLAEQELVLSRVAELVAEYTVDAVVVAGDLYDRAVPAAEAVEACVRILRRIRAAGAEIVLTSGNHDSAARLGAFGEFAAAGGLHLRTRIGELHEPVLLPSAGFAGGTSSGSAQQSGGVAVYGIPYLEPDPARAALNRTQQVAGASTVEKRGHTAVLSEAMNRIRADLATRPGVRSVVLAHAFVTGGQASESERSLAVGGVEQVSSEVFSGVDYVALGHLHGPQTLAENVRYSGSPLAYSFSEARHTKSVWLVELGEQGLSTVEQVLLPVPRPLATLTGELEQLLADSALEEFREHYLSVTLTDPVRPLEAMRRLQERFPHAVHLSWEPPSTGESAPANQQYSSRTRGRKDPEVVEGFLAHCRGSEPTDSEQQWLQEALSAVNTAEVRA